MSRRKTLIKMRSKPKKPVKQIQDNEINLYDGRSLQEILETIDKGVDLSQVIVDSRYDYDEHEELFFKYQTPEHDEDFQVRMDKYNQDLKNYNKWCQKNKDLIKEELRLRKEEEENKVKKNREVRRRHLEKELGKINKELKRQALGVKAKGRK